MSSSSPLLIDAGNRRLKWRLGNRDGYLDWNKGEPPSALPVPEAGGSNLALVASVRYGADQVQLLDHLQQAGWQVQSPSVESECAGLICGYTEPAQLGVDRWLAMLACWTRWKKAFVLVNAGTAMTLDLVFNTGKHGGGYIVAGLGLHRDALLARSEKLQRQYTPGEPLLEPGRDTGAAIDRGVLLTAVEMTRGAANRAGLGSARLVFSGADGAILAGHFPAAQVWDNIVLDGLLVWYGSVGR